MKIKVKEIDFKSFIIGFLLASVVFLAMGSNSGTQDVRIVGVSTYDNLHVQVEKINTSEEVPVKLSEVEYNIKVPVKIVDVEYGYKVPIKIENQPVDVRVK